MNKANIKEILDENVLLEILMCLIQKKCSDFNDQTKIYMIKIDELNLGGFRGSSGDFWVFIQDEWCKPPSVISEKEIKNPTVDEDDFSPEDLSETREVLVTLLEKVKSLYDEDHRDE